ncbi:undecaprenyldiphospho-muramoylpentapeptide beta-N-acetylglucosaminyltransferase [Kibdelosporangium philippinense]|uniref:undecaprenyldiphospho-muramoylpentapeptide beta-N-acetylglucosaminyltransferase n=1 Tax=Kibdelosporangium philippinense TaxID=211113 RepID=UPI0035585A72
MPVRTKEDVINQGPCVVVAGGGTAGHIEPALALADAVRRARPDARVVALGTPRGLEGKIVPARGYQLEMIPPVPMPRKPTMDLLKLPLNVRRAIKQTRDVLDRVGADVVVGFGGYVSLPAYLAARGRLPIVVHEANARTGMANKVGARYAARVAAAVPDSGLPNAEVIGIPLRQSITELDRQALRDEARRFFRLHPHAPTLLVFGGSQGAVSINNSVAPLASEFARAGIGVLHAHGAKNTLAVQQIPGAPPYVPVPYLERMDLAYAAADAVLCRSGAMTVAEVSAVGLPAVYVPLPIGNGEQAFNCRPQVTAGGAIMIPDNELSPDKLREVLLPLLTNPRRLSAMGAAAQSTGHGSAADVLAKMVLDVVRK